MDPRHPAITAIIPAHDEASCVGRATASVLAQQPPVAALIVVDDGSSDDTAGAAVRAAAGDPRLRVVRQAQAGVSAARNRGVAEATTPWIALLDADDEWRPGKLAAQLDVMASDPAADLLFSDFELMVDGRAREASGLALSGEPLVRSGPAWPAILRGNYVPTSSVLVRRALVEQAGGFDPAFSRCEDWDLWTRVAHGGARFRFVERRLHVKHHRSRGRLSSDDERTIADSVRLMRLWQERLDADADADAAAIVADELSRRALVWARFRYEAGDADGARALLRDHRDVLRRRHRLAARLALALAPGLTRHVWLGWKRLRDAGRTRLAAREDTAR